MVDLAAKAGYQLDFSTLSYQSLASSENRFQVLVMKNKNFLVLHHKDKNGVSGFDPKSGAVIDIARNNFLNNWSGGVLTLVL